MSDQDKNSIQRFGRHSRKRDLPRPQSLFPPEDDIEIVEHEPEPESPSEEIIEEVVEPIDDAVIPTFDLEALALPDRDNDALASLSKLSKKDVRAPIITPQTERYPPLNPADLIQEEEKPEPAQPVQVAKPLHNIRNNIITVLAVLGTILFVVWFGAVWVDPQTAWNPFPPATPFVVITATPGQAEVDPMLPTANADGQIFIIATDAPTPTLSATDSPYPFVPSAVTYAPNSNDLACNWWSIAGTITDEIGLGVNGYRVQIIGDGVNETVFSGTSQVFGDGGYELPLIGTPQVAQFTVQLFDPEATPQSQPVTVTTRSDCSANVTMINFVRNQ